MSALREPDSPNPSAGRQMARQPSRDRNPDESSEKKHDKKSHQGKSVQNVQITIVMKQALFDLIVDEQIEVRELNRNQFLRSLITECLRARRKKRGLETPQDVDKAD